MRYLTQNIYEIDDLNYLKDLFYNFEEFNQVNLGKLNKSLNLFYGYKAENIEHWKNEFKDVIKKKGAISKIGKQKYVDTNTDEYKSITTKTIIEKAFEKKTDIKCKLNNLYESNFFNKTIIYEAPPYLLSIKESDGTAKTEIISEFILDNECNSPYSNAIRGCFDDKNSSINSILKKNNCGFFDVIPMPLPINSDLRNKWATEDRFLISGKRIFVHFFEWALDNYKRKVNISDKQKHKIAIGIPLNNAITLYENYASNEIVEFGYHQNQKILFPEPHSIEFKNKKLGLWVHQFKNCVISTSNTPNSELMKLALDVKSPEVNII
jgi:hypothetical protein